MAGFLRALGVLVIILGIAVAVIAGWSLMDDAHFRETAAAYARHPEHALFRADYMAAAAQHYGLMAAAAGGVIGGLTLGGILLALGELLRRVPRR
jgi:hypothetical protein